MCNNATLATCQVCQSAGMRDKRMWNSKTATPSPNSPSAKKGFCLNRPSNGGVGGGFGPIEITDCITEGG